MKLSIVAGLFVLGLVCPGLHAVGHRKLFMRYAKMKVLEQCYGEKLLTEWQDWMAAKIDECRAKRTARSADLSMEDDSMEDLHETVLSADQLAALKKKKEQKMKMLSCVMDAMNITVTAEGSVDTAPILTYLKNAQMDSALKSDLTARIERCGKMKMGRSCRPSAPSPPAGDPALPAKMGFMRCEVRARLQACVASDLNKAKNKNMFKLAAIEDLFHNYHHDDDIDDVYDDDDDDDDDDV